MFRYTKRKSYKERQLERAFGPVKQKRIPKKQVETQNQKTIVKYLNNLGMGFFYRVKNMGTFDPRGFYRRRADELVAIPDICGYTVTGRAVFIEVKYVQKIENKKKLLFKVRISDDQIRFLKDAYDKGCIAGVAFNFDDALNIAKDNNERYLRHPRTYCFMPEEWLKEYEQFYIKKRAENTALKKDPVYHAMYSKD